MVFLKRSLFFTVGLLMLVIISSCGSAPTSTSSGSTSNPGSSGAYGKGTTAPTQSTASTPTAAASGTGNVVVKTTSVTVNGKATTVLTDSKGMTLYYFTPDTASKTACTASCAQTWPPLLFSTTGKPAAASKLPGELEVYKNPNGQQIIYNDHPLYTYGGDSAAGQTNGEGIGGMWFVATPTVAKNKP